MHEVSDAGGPEGTPGYVIALSMNGTGWRYREAKGGTELFSPWKL